MTDLWGPHRPSVSTHGSALRIPQVYGACNLWRSMMRVRARFRFINPWERSTSTLFPSYFFERKEEKRKENFEKPKKIMFPSFLLERREKKREGNSFKSSLLTFFPILGWFGKKEVLAFLKNYYHQNTLNLKY